ncbi:MAG: oxidoreductase [Candidatus Marinimicrobia bacterium]|nr:oxidoreductase [Candidatus Neomarinimicrobiota bacterium]
MIEQTANVVKPLDKSRVLITGGTSGIGLEAAIQFGLSGVPRILLIGRNSERGESAKQKILKAAPTTQVDFISVDMNRVEGAHTVFEHVKNLYGGVDILVNSMGSDQVPELFHQMPVERIDETVVRLTSIMNICHFIQPMMKEQGGGSIVNIASDAAKFATPGEAVIGAVMAGIVMFTRTLAIEGKRDGIRANVLTPSIVEGTLTYDRVMAPGFSGKLFEKAKKAAHLGVVRPEDIAPMIVFMTSPAAARMTGQAISINGGISAG